MPGVLIRDHYPCVFDGESYYVREIDAARVNIPDAGEGVSIRIIPAGDMNNLQYGDTTLLLTFNDARLLAQAILSVAFEGVRGTDYRSVLVDDALDLDDLLGAEPEVGRLPADPREFGKWFESHGRTDDPDLPADWGKVTFTPMNTDTLPRVDAGGTEGIIKAMDGGLA